MIYTSGYFRQHVKVKDYELRGRIFKSESSLHFILNIILNSAEGLMVVVVVMMMMVIMMICGRI
jgi:RsiW-degrading membrane proteinase PrsW (M82 family)